MIDTLRRYEKDTINGIFHFHIFLTLTQTETDTETDMTGLCY